MPDVLVVLELTGKILCQTKCKGDWSAKKGNFLSLISVYHSQIIVIFMFVCVNRSHQCLQLLLPCHQCY